MCTTGSRRSLSLEEVERYHRDGYVVPSAVMLQNDEMLLASQALDHLLESNPDVLPEQLVNAHLEDGDSQGMGVRGSRVFRDLASHRNIVDAVSQVLDTDDVILWGCQVFCKPPGVGKAVPWHQDGQCARTLIPRHMSGRLLTAPPVHPTSFLPSECVPPEWCLPPDWPIEPLRACTVWMALDVSVLENGALRVIPGTQHELLDHEVRSDEEAAISVVIPDKTLGAERLSRAQTLTLARGEMSIHDAMLVHGSGVNRSTSRRAGVAMHYMPASCHFRRDVRTFADREGGLTLDFSTRPLLQVKGRNRHPGNTLFL